MKYRIRIDNQLFEVEINNLQERPIVVSVNGTDIEVWPENINQAPSIVSPEAKTSTKSKQMIREKNSGESNDIVTNNMITAPIPGVVLSVNVKIGDEVESGQELCVIEAMKMRNVIRTPRGGKIDGLYVITGQTVDHGEKLVKLAN